ATSGSPARSAARSRAGSATAMAKRAIRNTWRPRRSACPTLPNHISEFARVASDSIEHVGRACHGSTMDTRHQLQGIELRYALTMYLLQHGPTTVNELIEAMTWQGFDIGGRASKQVSDALRLERRRGRVRRLALGLYGPGY